MSLEIFVWVFGNEVIICLIVGICLCGVMFEEDCVNEVDFLVDKKELVEYFMLFDLGCNDVGCVVKIGIVKLIEEFIIECYSYVMYIVLNVVGELYED